MSVTDYRGKLIARKNGYSLYEYSTGIHPESYYKIVTTKERKEMNYRYMLPKRNHKEAKKWFQECIRDYTK